MFTGTDVNVVN